VHTRGRRPVILGYDMVSPLGVTFEEQWRRAVAGESGVGPLTRFATDADFPVKVAGEVPDFDAAPYPFLGDRAMALWTSPIFKHALLVVHRALERSGVEVTPEVAPRVATTFSSAVGGVDAVLAADRALVARGELPKPAINPNNCINMVSGKVSILTGATGPIVSGINACATGNTSLILGAMLLATDQADVAICGAVDFPLVEVVVAGFATMRGAYRPRPGTPHDPPEACSRPFAAARRGFVVSEGAAAIILSTEDFACAHGLPYSVELAGWGMSSDAHHYVAPHAPTVAHCLRVTLERAGLAPEDVQSVNAHAASTRAGDRVEAECLSAVFSGRVPPTTANKSLIGHAMGASSAIESVLAIEGMLAGLVPPTRNYTPSDDVDLASVSAEAQQVEQEHVLKNAFGFGGANACVVLRRVA
jgi:3-oxoacyl-[acyl-carrier-protein] synthase II